MTENDLRLIREIGTTGFCIYKYFEKNPRARNREASIDLSLSEKTIVDQLSKLEYYKVLKRNHENNNAGKRVISLNQSFEWQIYQ